MMEKLKNRIKNRIKNQAQENLRSEQSQAQPANENRPCSICRSPDYQACGCEARFTITPEILQRLFFEAEVTLKNQMCNITDNLTDIYAGIEILIFEIKMVVSLQQKRADLLEDIQNDNPD